MARHPECLGLGIEKSIFDGTESFDDHAARRWPGEAIELGIDPLVVVWILSDDPLGEPLDYLADPGEPKPSSNSLQPTMSPSVVSLRK